MPLPSIRPAFSARKTFTLSPLNAANAPPINRRVTNAFAPTPRETHWFREPELFSDLAQETLRRMKPNRVFQTEAHGISDGREITGLRLLQTLHRLKHEPMPKTRRGLLQRVAATLNDLRQQAPIRCIEKNENIFRRAQQEAFQEHPIDVLEFNHVRNDLRRPDGSMDTEAQHWLDAICRTVFIHGKDATGMRYLQTKQPLRHRYCHRQVGDMLARAEAMPNELDLVVTRNSAFYLGWDETLPLEAAFIKMRKEGSAMFARYLDLVGTKLRPGGLFCVGAMEAARLVPNKQENAANVALLERHKLRVIPNDCVRHDFYEQDAAGQIHAFRHLPMVFEKKAD